ncbi:MAG: DUF6514 family protein [Oscillospiraceae bacterium]|nr:DUF6514 family protein [Oscillospiraceae bacterium]
MRKFYAEATILCDSGEPAALRYYLLFRRGYGVRIVMRRKGDVQRAQLRCCSKSESLALLAVLHRNTVTPCTLHEAADACLAKIDNF